MIESILSIVASSGSGMGGRQSALASISFVLRLSVCVCVCVCLALSLLLVGNLSAAFRQLHWPSIMADLRENVNGLAAWHRGR